MERGELTVAEFGVLVGSILTIVLALADKRDGDAMPVGALKLSQRAEAGSGRAGRPTGRGRCCPGGGPCNTQQLHNQSKHTYRYI